MRWRRWGTQAILYTFPAICWAYNAGFLFSTFVTGVFWTGPFVRTPPPVTPAVLADSIACQGPCVSHDSSPPSSSNYSRPGCVLLARIFLGVLVFLLGLKRSSVYPCFASVSLSPVPGASAPAGMGQIDR